jgi:ribosomal protein S27AE
MDEEQAVWLDGNALAGMLYDLFGTEMTTVQRSCPACGTRSAIGAHRAYHGAGEVLRCPSCSALAMRIAVLPLRRVVHVTGAFTLDLPRR